MKRLTSFLLTLVMCVTLLASLPTTASAASTTGQMQDTSSDENGTIYWELTTTGLLTATLKISGDGYMPNGTDQSWYSALGNRYLTEVVIEEGVKSIMEGAFYGETYLESVTLPDSIEFIGEAAFSETSIKAVTLPKNLADFDATIFNSQSIISYDVHPENPYYAAVDGVVYSKDMTELVAYPIGLYANGGNNSFTIPKTVTKICDYAFLKCQHEAFTIPSNVKTIGMQAFAGCTQLTDLKILNGVEGIYDGAFLACDSLKSISLPSSVNYIGYCALGYVYAFDFDGLSFMLDQLGVNHPVINESNAAIYVEYTPYTLNDFVYCTVKENATIYAPKNSAGHNYCKMFGVAYKQSQAITPKLVSATQTTEGVEVKWSSSSDADGYYIYRKNKKGDYEKIATVKGKSKTTYTDKKAYSSYKNTYTVRAYNSTGKSWYYQKGVSTYYIKAPTLTSATNTTGGVKIKWDKVTGAVNYNIYRRKKGESYWEYIGITKKAVTSFTDTTATNGQTYYYTVRAFDNESVSAYNKTGVSTKYVSAPKISSVKNTSSGVKISWKKVSGSTSYRIYRKTSSGSWTLLDKVSKDKNTFTDKTAKSGVKYTYSVKAVNNPKVSGYNTKTIEYLKQPKITGAKSTKAGIVINYKKISGATKYYIYRKSAVDDEWTRIATVKGEKTLTYTDATAKKGKTYYYSVRAVSGSYKSSYNTTGYKIKDKY